ncbi:MAG: methyltransferase domain-containing protein [Candidatus Limnocylindrales bacterium]
MTAPDPPSRPLATYEDLGYRDVFWPARAYENECDRIALRALLPPSGGRLIEVGAGFGRLADEYSGYGEVVLLDSSPVHVAAALETLGGDPRFDIELGDAAALPFPDGRFDTAVCVRVLHHFGDPAPVIAELGRVVRPGGVLVLEYANKRNLKSIARRVLGRHAWSPFEPGAVEYRPFHYDHSPVSVRRALRRAGFEVERVRAASLFRIPGLTRRLPPGSLARLEALLQEPLGSITPGPSVFVLARRSAG